MTILIDRLLESQLEEALRRAMEGRPLLIRCRQPATLERLRAVAAEALLLDALDVPGDQPPDAALSAAMQGRTGRFARMSDIIVDPSLGHMLFIVAGTTSAQSWNSVAGLWARNRKRSAGPALCIVNHAGPVPTDCLWLDDGSLIGPAESLLMARTLRREPPLLAEAADQVAIECASGNLKVLEALLSLPEPERFMPDLWLSRQPATSTANTIWRGRETENAIRVAHRDHTLIRSRIWRGQMQILFPWLEQVRERFIGRHGARIDAGFWDQNGQPLDVVDYEWGHLTTALQCQRKDVLATHANNMRILRNALAHSDPVEYKLANRAFLSSQKLMEFF